MQLASSGGRRLRHAALAARKLALEDGRTVTRKELSAAAREAEKALQLRPTLRLVLSELVACWGEQEWDRIMSGGRAGALTMDREAAVSSENLTSALEQLREQPSCVPIMPGPRHWPIFCDLCRQADVKGSHIWDAYLAAMAIEHGCEWITSDRDFARFPALRWRHPF